MPRARGLARPVRATTAVLRRMWHSPLLMTWGASGVRSLNLILVLPLIVTRLEPAEIAVWYLFTTLIQLQLLADLGFSPTFVRVFAFAAGGADRTELSDRRATGPGPKHAGPNWSTVEAIWGTVHSVYTRLTIGAVCGLLLVGTPFVYRPISATDQASAWVAWGVILLASTVILRGNAYAAYLTGLDHVALVRRWEAVMVLMATLTQAAVLVAGGGLLALTVAHQFWMVLNVARNWYLARHVEEGRLMSFSTRAETVVMEAVWPSAWRSGVGLVMGNLPLQLTGLFYAQVAPAQRAAEYLVSLNVLTSIRGFAMAPFYSRLPAMARLRATGEKSRLEFIAGRGMALSYWTFVAFVIGVGVAGDRLLIMLGANASLTDATVWSLMGFGLLLERYGAMHLQLYSTTNHIVWHVANGISGAAMIVVAWALFSRLDLLAFPLALIISYAAFYIPYVVPKSWALFEGSPRRLDLRCFVPAAAVMLAYSVVIALMAGA